MIIKNKFTFRFQPEEYISEDFHTLCMEKYLIISIMGVIALSIGITILTNYYIHFGD